jgi:hypothetical protein
LATLPVPSTSLASDPVFEHPGGEALLRLEFQRGRVKMRGGLRFEKVRAFCFRAEGHCTVWHVEGAYDTLVEVTPSAWVADLLRAEPGETWGRWEIRHFMVFVDGAGCYEVAAETWSWLPEEERK